MNVITTFVPSPSSGPSPNFGPSPSPNPVLTLALVLALVLVLSPTPTSLERWQCHSWCCDESIETDYQCGQNLNGAYLISNRRQLYTMELVLSRSAHMTTTDMLNSGGGVDMRRFGGISLRCVRVMRVRGVSIRGTGRAGVCRVSVWWAGAGGGVVMPWWGTRFTWRLCRGHGRLWPRTFQLT